MNKQEYLTALEKALKAADVSDCSDILEEYKEHFDLKTADGYGEEEIAARLAPPEEIAEQYKDIAEEEVVDEPADKQAGVAEVKAVVTAGVVLVDMIVAPILIVLYAWVFTFGVFAMANAALGGFLVAGLSQITQASPHIHVPPMPYVCSLLLGIALLALAALSAVGTEYFRLYVTQMLRKFARWHKNALGKGGPFSPPLPLHPWLSPIKRKVMRTIALVSVALFVVAFVAALASMMIAAASFEPWHVWGWFE